MLIILPEPCFLMIGRTAWRYADHPKHVGLILCLYLVYSNLFKGSCQRVSCIIYKQVNPASLR